MSETLEKKRELEVFAGGETGPATAGVRVDTSKDRPMSVFKGVSREIVGSIILAGATILAATLHYRGVELSTAVTIFLAGLIIKILLTIIK
ncbi:MAG: hypothetical protein QXI59_07090 [Candidatus Bathyarchaeia archaeon]|nr:hypothetical protein [Candidatus Bathyarchaeota archaeon]